MFLTIACFVVLACLLYRLLSNVWSVSNLTKKPVLITGCDTGFGHLLTIKLVNNGIPTFAGCLTEKGETELRKATAGAPGKLWTFRLDVTKEESVQTAFAFVKNQLGPEQGLWGLVNNAGILGQTGPGDWLNIDHYQKTLDVNCLGVIRATHAFKPLVKKEKGRIVIITSIFGRYSVCGFGPYCVSKFATEAYADALRTEMSPFKVSVHILEPGLHVTGITNAQTATNSLADLWQRLPNDLQEEFGEEFFTRSSACLTREFDAISGDANHVVDAYYHALTSRLPKLRYVVGLDALLVYRPLSVLPTFVGDAFLRLAIRVKNVPIPRVCNQG